MINNEFCPDCLKNSTCMWYKKLYKLEGTSKEPILLDITVDNCEEYLDENGSDVPDSSDNSGE